jgi:hypothetical protein
VEHNGKTYIFVEQQIGSGNGTLGYIELFPNLTHSDFTPILEKEYHLSFPNIFRIKHDDKDIWYMIPETHENRTIDLYRAKDFPNQWVHETTLMRNVQAVDSVVLLYQEKWWLFTSIGTETIPINKNLSLFYSNTFPSANWISHPQNPIYDNLANSRMAGAVFFDKKSGCLNRPAQNCLKDYGQKTNINEVIELNPLSYKERLIKTINPERDFHVVCTHTINYSEKYMLRDIKTRRFRLYKK